MIIHFKRVRQKIGWPPLALRTLAIRDTCHADSCHLGQLPFGTVAIRDTCHSTHLPFRTVAIRDSCPSDTCPSIHNLNFHAKNVALLSIYPKYIFFLRLLFFHSESSVSVCEFLRKKFETFQTISASKGEIEQFENIRILKI